MKPDTKRALIFLAGVSALTLGVWHGLFKSPTPTIDVATTTATAPISKPSHQAPLREVPLVPKRISRLPTTEKQPPLAKTPYGEGLNVVMSPLDEYQTYPEPGRTRPKVPQRIAPTTDVENDPDALNPFSYVADPEIRPATRATFVSDPDELILPQPAKTPEPGGYQNAISPEEDLLKPLEAKYGTSPNTIKAPAASVENQPDAPNVGPIDVPNVDPIDPLDLKPPNTSVGQAQPTPPTYTPADSAPLDAAKSTGPHPDEDLLQNVPSRDVSIPAAEEIPTPYPDTNKPPVTAPATPPVTTPITPPAATPVTPPATPPATPPEQTTPPARSSPGNWDVNAPPADDEDLLQNLNTNPAQETPAPNNVQAKPDYPTTEKSPPATPREPATPKLNPHASAAKSNTSASVPDGVDPHLDLYSQTLFPSAKECRKCHEEIYDEWAVSSHAYAAISPMFHKFEQTIHALTQGTISYFCYRCHAPVATTIGHPREASIWESVPSATEGVTCIACHRVDENYGKVNGERRIIPGSIHEPVYGFGYGEGLKEVLANKSKYKVKTGEGDEKGPGQDIHGKVIHFEQIGTSHFCVSCHQVAVVPGIALEVVWAQYRASPACKQGITCQECHMGIEPGVAAGYDTGPVAIVNDVGISPERKHSNHMFYGPGYSIAHPGIFPFNPKADDWTVREWMSFDYRAGWGTKEFEDALDDEKIEKPNFPEVWEEADDRMDAREVVEANLGKLEAKREMRHRLMENGSHLEGPIFEKNPRAGRPLSFHYEVTNTNSGHNMPSGSLGAQPQLWLNVALTGPNGQHLWESGYVDANGDVADVHSLEVAAGRIRRDVQLFNLQTKFLITGVKGTDREMYLPINTDFDQLPFIRQSGFPVTVMNHPPFIRMEGHSIPPLGTRKAKYRVPARLMKQPGAYRLSVRMRSRAEPIYFMRFCKATPEMERNMNEWMLDYHEQAFEFFVP